MSDTERTETNDGTMEDEIWEDPNENQPNSTRNDDLRTLDATGDAGYPIEWERNMLEREWDLLRREKELLKRQKSAGMYSEERHTVSFGSATQLLPEFNPDKSNSLTAAQWINKVTQLAYTFKWNDDMLLFNAIQKLGGAARLWFEGYRGTLTDWPTFSKQIIIDFPTLIDDADIHFELSKRKKKYNESYEYFVYDVKAVASKGNISERAIIKYIISGITDRELSRLLAVSYPNDIHELLTKIKNYESTCQVQGRATSHQHQASMPKPTTSNVNPESNKVPQGNEKKCFNCNEYGHISIKCPKPQRKPRCYACDRVGHRQRDCPSNSKNVNRISVVPPDVYHKIVDVDGLKLMAFIDLGSDVVTLREDAHDASIRVETANVRLKGFGKGETCTIGKRYAKITVDGIVIDAEVYIVPNESQDKQLIIGRSALDQPGIRIIKDTTLKIERMSEDLNQPKDEKTTNEETPDYEIEDKEMTEDEEMEDEEDKCHYVITMETMSKQEGRGNVQGDNSVTGDAKCELKGTKRAAEDKTDDAKKQRKEENGANSEEEDIEEEEEEGAEGEEEDDEEDIPEGDDEELEGEGWHDKFV